MSKIKKQTDLLLQGNVFKSILKISIPVILANTLQTVYQLIDTFWVGRLGKDAVAAVSLSFPVVFFLISLAMGFTMAGSILISQYNGKGDRKNVSLATGQTFSLVLLIAIIAMLLGYLSTNWLFGFLTENETVFNQGVSYLKISFLAMPAMFIYIIFQSALHGIGEVKLPMIVILLTVIVNFFIDPLFMYGWKFIPAMGVTGVAWATFVTEYLSAIIAIVIMFLGKYHFNLKLNDFILQKKWVKNLFKLGLPASLEMSSRSLSILLMTFVVSILGTLTVAAYGIGTRILSFIIIPAMGLAISTSTLVGNNLGAKQFERTEEIAKTAMKIAFVALTILGIMIFIFAKQITAFLIPNEIEVINESAKYIRIMSLTFGFIGVQMTIIGALKGAGKTLISMNLAIAHTSILFIISFILAHLLKWNATGIWIAYPLANFFAMLFAIFFYKQKKWLNHNLLHQS